jgi:hypothetical protein
MKNQKFEVGLFKANVTELSSEQLVNTNGGFLIIILQAAAIYAAICSVAYGAGALYGIATKK